MSILLSRKFLTALSGLILACLSQWAKLPIEVIQAIGILFSAATVAIGVDDSGGWMGGEQPKHHNLAEVIMGLLRNRYFQTALAGLLGTLLVHYSGMSAEVIQYIVLLFSAVISVGSVETAVKRAMAK